MIPTADVEAAQALVDAARLHAEPWQDDGGGGYECANCQKVLWLRSFEYEPRGLCDECADNTLNEVGPILSALLDEVTALRADNERMRAVCDVASELLAIARKCVDRAYMGCKRTTMTSDCRNSKPCRLAGCTYCSMRGIAGAPTYDALAAEVVRLRAENKRMRAALTEIRDGARRASIKTLVLAAIAAAAQRAIDAAGVGGEK